VQHDRSKCIEVVKHFIKEKLDSGLINTPCVSTQNNPVDILTKGLNRKNYCAKLGMKNTYSPTWRSGGVSKLWCSLCILGSFLWSI